MPAAKTSVMKRDGAHAAGMRRPLGKRPRNPDAGARRVSSAWRV
jgi:hypothetical protein